MDVTYNFTAGTRAVAEQVNTNFADVKSAIDPLETDVAAIQAQLTSGIILPDGSVDFTSLQSYKTVAVNNATNATPIVITAVAHGFLTGDKVYISGVGGNTAANSVFTITKIGTDTFSLNDSVGNGAYTSGGTCVIYPVADDNLIHKAYVDPYFPTASTANMPTLANNVSDANNDIDFSAGFCYDLNTNVKIINTAITKRLDATFVAGTNQGGLDTGSKANSTWYACFAISKLNGTADFLFSTSATSPTMPTDYINKRRIGWILTNGSGNILGFYQYGDNFYYKTVTTDLNITAQVTSFTDLILSTPINCIALLQCVVSVASATGGYLSFKSKVNNSEVNYIAFTFGGTGAQDFYILVDSASKIQYKYISTSPEYARIYNFGYIDKRGVN